MKKLFILFILFYTGLFSQTIVKGPYLQIGTQNSMIVRWETNIATDSKVAFGTSSVALTSSVTNAASVTSHIIKLSGLTPLTKYYYSIGTTTAIIQSGAGNYFLTSPIPNTEGQYRFWVVGDCGNASTNQTNCKNQYVAFTGTTATNGWLLLGDNAYSNGSDPQFNTEFFGIYQNDIMKCSPLWPTPGNHDYNNGASTATTVPYYSIFSTPSNAEAGGIASGTPAYYSYDYGNIHFLSLDSYGTVGGNKMYDTTGAQAIWVKADLAASNKRWKVAYWHHPPYTMGSHNSDSEADLAKVRTDFIRILERMGVDLILCGHSHDYERSKLMNGHYGNEASFVAATHNLSSSSALYDASVNSCPYIKDSLTKKIGTVYTLSGSAGQLGGTQASFPHAAMYYSNATNGGSLVLDFDANRLDAKWVGADGVIRDKYTMFKDVNVVRSYTVLPGVSTTITASWPGSYTWSNAATTRSIVVSPTTTTTYWVKDPNTCVADTFKFKVLPAVNFSSVAPYCINNSILFSDLSTNLPVSWGWTVTPIAGVTINTSASKNPTITFNNPGTYSISLTSNNAYGPGIPTTKTITVNPLPSITATAIPSAICLGQSAQISASGGNTYLWSTSATTSSISVSPIANTNYTVTGTDLNGCLASKTIAISINPNPTVTASSTNTLLCAGQSATLSANGASTYSWNTGATSANIAISPTISTNYTVTGTNSFGCSNSTSLSQVVSNCTGIQQIAYGNASITIFPNPNNGTFNVELTGPITFEMQVFNAIGELVYKGSLFQGANKIELKVKEGIYYYTISEGKNIADQGKLIIQ